MAEGAILATLKILGETMAKEVAMPVISKISKLSSTCANLEANMKNINSELRVMQGFLNGIEANHMSNESQIAWIKEVRGLANHIEDIVVEFAYLIDNQKFAGILFYVTKTFREPKLLVNIKRIASQLLEAEKSLKRLAEMKERWTTNIRNGQNVDYSIGYSHEIAISAHFIDEDQIVGIEENRMKLTMWLNSKDTQLFVISVWGMGGVGKTTLVTNVYKRQKITLIVMHGLTSLNLTPWRMFSDI